MIRSLKRGIGDVFGDMYNQKGTDKVSYTICKLFQYLEKKEFWRSEELERSLLYTMHHGNDGQVYNTSVM